MAPTYQYRQITFGKTSLLGRLGLLAGVAIAVALVIALVILSIGLAIILVPVVALTLAIVRWRLGKLQKAAAARPAEPGADPRVIEADYVVIDRNRDPR